MIIRIIEGLDRLLKTVLLCLAAAMIITVTWQVLSRYVFQNPSSVTEEIARFQLIWLGLLGTAYAFRNHMHVKIDILSASISGRVKRYGDIFSMLACIAFALIVLLYGGALGILMAYVYSAVPLCGTLICVYASYFCWQILCGQTPDQFNDK